MGPLGPLPWKMMDHILKSWDNDPGPTINLKDCICDVEYFHIICFRSFDKASQCVLNKTENCSKEIAGDVLKKLEDIKPKAMKACMMEMKACVVHFEESGKNHMSRDM